MVRHQSLLALSALALTGGALVHADQERTCLVNNGPAFLESWGSLPSGGIVLDLADGVGGLDRAVPGFPPESGMRSICGFSSPQLPGWQSIARAAGELSNPIMPTSGGLLGASSFQINPTPTSFTSYPDWMTWSQFPYQGTRLWNVGGGTSANLVTFWEHPFIWGLFGTTPIAASFVRVASGTATIVECDIAFNAMTESASNNNRPLWTFVEDNVALGVTLASRSLSNYGSTTAAFQDPLFAYADIEGVLVHELGHLAGMGHSLVDGPTSTQDSRTPTLYANAQAQPYSQTVTTSQSSCTTGLTFSANGANTLYRGIVGVPARTLEADDVAALSVAYPGGDQGLLGSITGSVSDASGIVQGAHVVAISTTDAEVLRVGVLTYDAGTFTVGSLPPGDYYLMVEPPDLAGYFAGTSPPEYIDPSAFCGGPPSFTAEFWNETEGFGELMPQEATAIRVSAGQSSGPFAFQVDAFGGNPLTTAACTTPGANRVCSPYSIRGAIHQDLGDPTAELALRYTGGQPGDRVILAFALDRRPGLFEAQLLEPSLQAPTHVGTVDGTIGANGSYDLFLPVNASLAHTSFFVQALLVTEDGSPNLLSNTVTTWLER